MEFLSSVPFIVRVLASLCAILIFQKLTKRLDAAMLLGMLILGLSLGHSPSAVGATAFSRLASLDTLFLCLAVTGIIWLSGLMSQAGIMRDLVVRLKSRLSKRWIFIVLPAVVGLLPMPGGALFSCPLLDDADEDAALTPGLKTKVNFWFRHVWEFWWPLYPGVLLAVDMSGLPVWKLAVVQFPLTLAAIAAGAAFLLPKAPAGGAEKSGGGPRLPVFPLLLPIFTVVAVYAVILAVFPFISAVSSFLPMLLGTIAALAVLQVQRPATAATWKKTMLSPKWVGLVVIIVLARMYGAFIDGELPGGGILMEQVRGELNAYGIPAVLLIALIPFVSGLTTGITIGYIGASFPVVLSLAGETAGGYFAAVILGYTCGFLGMMLSPIHVCLIVTNQYFKTSVAGSLVGLLKPAAATFAAAAAYAFLWWSIG